MLRVSKSPDFKLLLTRVIEPAGGPGVELATLEDAARFVGAMRPWRQAWPHRDYAAELLLPGLFEKEVSVRNRSDGDRQIELEYDEGCP